MRSLVCRILLLTIALSGLAHSRAWAQGSTKTRLSGSVLDSSGGVLPGATVELKNQRTGVLTNTVTTQAGVFDVPAIDPGLYTVTVSLSGFKTSVMTEVELLSGTARALKVTLDVGAVTQEVKVVGGSQAPVTLHELQARARVEVVELPLKARDILTQRQREIGIQDRRVTSCHVAYEW